MIVLQKWNYDTKKYQTVLYSDKINGDNLHFILFTEDMDEKVNCPHCLKKIRYGEGYTSLEFHNSHGLGFPVCEECYNKEWERRRKYESIEN